MTRDWVDVSTLPSFYDINRLKMHELTYLFTTDGFFDAGMLLAASKTSKEDEDSEKAVHKSRHVGRRLRIAEY